MEEVLQAVALKQQLDSLRPIDKEQEGRIMQKFRLDWNYHSNNLEGNSLTYGETKALLMYGLTAHGKPLRDHFEVTGHNEAVNWVMDVVKGDYPLTQNFIRELHTLLLKERYQVDAQTPDGQPTKKWVEVGKYKTSPNHVETKTGEMFYFATPEETPAEMTALMEWYDEKAADESFNKILLAAEFHYKFIRIHPFDDGNGRTARILMNFILMKFGYPPVIIKTQDKKNYLAVLELADTGNLEAFVNYIAKNLVHSLEIMIAGANGESIEEPDDIDKEIALLEKRLKGLGERSNAGKSGEVLSKLYQNTISELYSLLYIENQKFSKFYLDVIQRFPITYFTTVEGIFGGEELEDDLTYENFQDARKAFFGKLLTFQIATYFEKFNIVGFNEFNFQSRIIFNFSGIGYSITVNGAKFIEKPYAVELTKNEIQSIIKSESKRHTAFIEQKIAEKETGGQ
ncbi:hypothetical protein AM493_12995 [Flavobacterium akiainvivens]|uniref:Fido domain-containing protein n=1 Tax=Flavobacterium akiainvivens TaxID=1202724 RepID=A0A0M9VIL5_9FLAO|nr:Fic family protein [Flavobacterium akiainvivens]KOS06840.1 hypothetical protein AM493_12995 [Flavobacterium akiainvivens]SFQ75019.1 Fic family protein [Flavobacterium akiainvivens]